MNVSREEAREALAAVSAVRERTRRAVALGGGDVILMIWGVVWLIGYTVTQLTTGPLLGAVWTVLDVAGIAGTLFVVSRISNRVRDPMGPRIGFLWLALFGYSALWIWLAQPLSELQLSVLITTFVMFGYVVLGLWLDTILLWLGLAVTALALGAYLLVPEFFGFWMAFVGGGAIFATGLYIRRRW